MANRVVVNICGEEYTFVAEESASYMQKVGSYVSEKMDEVLNGAKVGRSAAAILTPASAPRPGGRGAYIKQSLAMSFCEPRS